MQLKLLAFLCFGLMTIFMQAQTNSANGGVLTPKGTLKVLIVYVTFKDAPTSNPKFKNSEQPATEWSKTPDGLPDGVDPETGECKRFFYAQESDFEKYKEDKSTYTSVSYQWDLHSLGQFKIIGKPFTDAKGKPTNISIDVSKANGWHVISQRVVEEMKRVNPNFDFSEFDQRKNSPNYAFDNSVHQPDKQVDYVVFWYRYSPTWKEQPIPNMNTWPGSTGGYAAVNYAKINDYEIVTGFTGCWGEALGDGLFTHEFAHTLYNCPHFHGINGTVGSYFYPQLVGWSAASNIHISVGLSAWERWYLGWIDPPFIRSANDTKKNNEFVLRDFNTTGDALRIEIPFSGGQSLWVENRQKKHPLEEHPWAGGGIDKGDYKIAPMQKGLYLTIEALTNDREKLISFSQANALKLIDADGYYDYSHSEKYEKNNWGHTMYEFSKNQANPLSGYSPLMFFREDINKDGIILLNTDPNMGGDNEGQLYIMREEIKAGEFANLYRALGSFDTEKYKDYAHPIPFSDGESIGIATNPTITNYPKYDAHKAAFEPIYINGLHLDFSAEGDDGNMRVKVRFDDTMIDRNLRWAGNIVLPDITHDDRPDLIVSKTLHIDRTGTVNRHTLNEDKTFINPTVFRVQKGASIKIAKRGKLIISNGSTLIIEKGAKLEVHKKGKIITKNGGKIQYL